MFLVEWAFIGSQAGTLSSYLSSPLSELFTPGSRGLLEPYIPGAHTSFSQLNRCCSKDMESILIV